MVLVKKELQAYNGYYEDLIIGEYQYIENGVEKANTLPNINITYLNQRRHNIDGNFLVDKNFRVWQCPDCSAIEKRLNTLLKDIPLSAPVFYPFLSYASDTFQHIFVLSVRESTLPYMIFFLYQLL